MAWDDTTYVEVMPAGESHWWAAYTSDETEESVRAKFRRQYGREPDVVKFLKHPGEWRAGPLMPHEVHRFW